MLTSVVLDRAAQSEVKKNLELKRTKKSGFYNNKEETVSRQFSLASQGFLMLS